MDALASFVSLRDSVPEWIERLESVARQVAERHAEFSRLSCADALAGLTPLRKPRTGSTESLRPNESDSPAPSPIPPLTTSSRPGATPGTSSRPIVTPESADPPSLVAAAHGIVIDPKSRRLFQDFREQAQARRKRKSSASVVSGRETGPARYRSRLSLIVYYDSAVQGGFEALVRRISAARNSLRKGRMAAVAAARLAGLGMEASPFAGSRTDHGPFRHSKRARLPSGPGPYKVGEDDPVLEAFENVDKDLEAAQSLCEVGAHQFLRDGTCAEEISGTMERFETCLRVAQEQAEALQKEEDAKWANAMGTLADNEASDTMMSGIETIAVDGKAEHPASAQNEDFPFVQVDESLRTDDHHSGHAPLSHSIDTDDPPRVDSSTMDGSHAVAVDSSLAIGPIHSEKVPTVDATDMGIQVDPALAVDSTVAIDDQHDPNAFQIDLTAFRRTRGR